MQFILIFLFVVVCALLCLVILLQPGKGSGMGAIGGGGAGGGTMFGARGAVGFLGKLTGWLAAAFMILSLFLARASINQSAVNPDRLGGAPTEAPAGAGDTGTEGEAPAEQGAGDDEAPEGE